MRISSRGSQLAMDTTRTSRCRVAAGVSWAESCTAATGQAAMLTPSSFCSQISVPGITGFTQTPSVRLFPRASRKHPSIQFRIFSFSMHPYHGIGCWQPREKTVWGFHLLQTGCAHRDHPNAGLGEEGTPHRGGCFENLVDPSTSGVVEYQTGKSFSKPSVQKTRRLRTRGHTHHDTHTHTIMYSTRPLV